MLQVLVEFWLNQNSYNGGRGDLLAQAQVGEYLQQRVNEGVLAMRMGAVSIVAVGLRLMLTVLHIVPPSRTSSLRVKST